MADYRKHPSYSAGYSAALAAKRRRGKSDPYSAGYDAGVRAANMFLRHGFEREDDGFVIALARGETSHPEHCGGMETSAESGEPGEVR